MAPKCICPHEDFSNAITNTSEFLTLDQAAAVASGYKSCCAHWVQSEDFSRLKPDRAEAVSLYRQELMQEVASGELKEVPFIKSSHYST